MQQFYVRRQLVNNQARLPLTDRNITFDAKSGNGMQLRTASLYFEVDSPISAPIAQESGNTFVLTLEQAAHIKFVTRWAQVESF